MLDFPNSIFIDDGSGGWGLGKLEGYPCSADISTRYDIKDTLHPMGHAGTDIAAQQGTPILAPAAGVVCDVFTLPNRGNQWDAFKDIFGNCVIIDHGDPGNDDDPRYTLYAHMNDTPMVKESDSVTTGQQLGIVGSTGFSSGPHLHWGVAKRNNRYFNWPSDVGPTGILLDALDYCTRAGANESNPTPNQDTNGVVVKVITPTNNRDAILAEIDFISQRLTDLRGMI